MIHNSSNVSLSSASTRALQAAVIGVFALLAGCQTTKSPPAPLVQTPTATHEFTVNDNDDVIGRLQVTHAHAEDTLSDIARRFNIGYEEIVRANPSVDPWLPKEGTPVILPTQFVLPDAPREGIVINLAALRLYYFPTPKKGEPQKVITHPIGIGLIGWKTPVGNTKVTGKRENPWWYPPASVRKEHKEEDGEILPAKVPPGPDNPLGQYALTLDWPSYLIHGTNQPYGIGIRASHGCIRLYPEDIAQLFDQIPVGTKITVVNEPQVYGHRGDTIYLQSYPVLDDYPPLKKVERQKATKQKPGASKIAESKARDSKNAATVAHADFANNPAVDHALIAELEKNPNGIALPISLPQMTLQKFVAAAPQVENRLPDQATWDGVE
jgi:L,D-transpeptidase ErfK/SrfK